MRIRLTHAGPILDAEADLSVPLTVLVGPNNSGKTWFSSAIYAAMKADLSGPTSLELAQELSDLSEMSIDLGLRGAEIAEALSRDAAPSLKAALEDCLGVDAGDSGLSLVSEMPFGLNKGFVRRVLSNPNFGIEVSLDDNMLVLRLIGTDLFFKTLRAMVPVKDVPASRVSASIADCFLRNGIRRTWALPAERAALVLFANELAAASIRGDGGFRYPWPIRDALATHFEVPFNKPGPFAPIADRLEARMLRGAIRRDERQRLLYIPVGSEQALTMHHSSSMVKSVASIVEHLRFRASVGDMLLIDEPELNLHPDNQRLLARALVEAANAGLRLVLSTHSDWFLREISRLVVAASLPADHLSRHGLSPSETLSAEKVQVLFFHDGGAQRLPMDAYGLDMGPLDQETHRLQADEQQIYLDRDGLIG
jgi:hypothetical protein